MKLVASLLIHNELDRYLSACLASLLDFCDEVRVLDDASSDGWQWSVARDSRVKVLANETPTFFEHEGRTRQKLWDWTMQSHPDRVLCIDADEFITDGATIRQWIEQYAAVPVWKLWLDEIWRAEEECLCVRVDGQWGSRGVPVLFSTPPEAARWRISNRALACGREPVEVVQQFARGSWMDAEVLHFGWTCEADRAARHARYAEHDQGNYHAKRHLDSILADGRAILQGRPWPIGLDDYKDAILARANRVSS